MTDYISTDIALPAKTMTVEWICSDGTKDFGFFDFEIKEFVTFDARSLQPIISWKPLNKQP